MGILPAFDGIDIGISHSRFNGYLDFEIPNALDEHVRLFVNEWVAATDEDKVLVSQMMDRVHSSVLSAYAERMSALAVREKDMGVLREAVLALGLAFLSAWDDRDTLTVMPLPWHSAKLLETDPKALFEKCANELDGRLAEALRMFSNRDSQNQTIECMGYRIGSNDGGFVYERTW